MFTNLSLKSNKVIFATESWVFSKIGNHPTMYISDFYSTTKNLKTTFFYMKINENEKKSFV